MIRLHLAAAVLALTISSGTCQAQATVQTEEQNIARAAIAFLDRTDLKGSETEAMARIRRLLADIALGKLRVVAKQAEQER